MFFLPFFYFFNFFKIFKTNQSKFFLIIFFFSTTNFILIERFSTDLIIFLVVCTLIFLKSNLMKLFLVFIGTLLKFYPIFLISIFVENKKMLFISALCLFLFLYFFYFDQIISTSENLIEMALFTAYGSRTMLKAFYHLSENYDLFLNATNINLFRNLIIILFFLYGSALCLLSYKYSNQNSLRNLSYNEKIFLIGSSVYLGTFILGANADYRLIFLIFTIPYILEINSLTFKYFLIASIIISINSFLFQFGDPLSISFFMRAILVFGCKFIIFTLFLIIYGKLLKKINFLKFS